MTSPKLASATAYGRLYRQPHTDEADTRDAKAALAAGLLVPSVTNVIDVLNKPYLMAWAGKRAAEDAVEISRTHPGLITQKPFEAIRYLKAAAERTSSAAADLGDQVHNVLEALALGQDPEISPQVAPFVASWRQFVSDFGVEFLHLEATCFGIANGLGYAGTADFIARVNGRVVVGDYKSGKSIHTEAALQLAALANATHITNEDQSGLLPMPVIDGGMVLHVTAAGYAVRTVDVHGDAWTHFSQLRGVWDFHQDNLVSRGPILMSGVITSPAQVTFPTRPAAPAADLAIVEALAPETHETKPAAKTAVKRAPSAKKAS